MQPLIRKEKAERERESAWYVVRGITGKRNDIYKLGRCQVPKPLLKIFHPERHHPVCTQNQSQPYIHVKSNK